MASVIILSRVVLSSRLGVVTLLFECGIPYPNPTITRVTGMVMRYPIHRIQRLEIQHNIALFRRVMGLLSFVKIPSKMQTIFLGTR